MKKINAKRLRFYIFIAFVVLSILLVFFSGIMNYNEGTIGNLLLKYDYISMPIYILLVSIAIATTLPVSVAVLAGFFIFTLYELILLTILGMIAGIYFLFYASRKFGKEGFKEYVKLKGERLKAFRNLLEADSTSLIVLLTFVYFFPSNLAGVVAGITNTKFYRFAIICLIGNLINSAAFIFLAYGIYILSWIYIIPSSIVLVLNTAVPLYIYRKHMKDIIILAFNRKVYSKAKNILSDQKNVDFKST